MEGSAITKNPAGGDEDKSSPSHTFERYSLPVRDAPDLHSTPSRFKVSVDRVGLAKLLFKEVFHYRFNMGLVLSRPCIYGVFGGPLGGFAPREHECVGCLRCTIEHPEIVKVEPNPLRWGWGDDFHNPLALDTVDHESRSGSVPVRGQGYRGKFGGAGWDGMWTDMSEIVRPTRDGIHGRESISTLVDLGGSPPLVDPDDLPDTPTLSLPLPTFLDLPPAQSQQIDLPEIWHRAAAMTKGMAFLPVRTVLEKGCPTTHIAPFFSSGEEHLCASFHGTRLVEAESLETALALQRALPQSVVSLRMPYPEDPTELVRLFQKGIRLFHLVADFHGIGPQGRFVLDLIQESHCALVSEGIRDQCSLIGTGGILLAEHTAKAILCGLDAVALDTALSIAIHGRPPGGFGGRDTRYSFPHIPVDWAAQRITNLLSAWRDQLLEIMGAMGLREIRRMRGEMGRALFQSILEKEAFSDIEGFPE